eukprot:6464168-Amphidinium_carterae.1
MTLQDADAEVYDVRRQDLVGKAFVKSGQMDGDMRLVGGLRNPFRSILHCGRMLKVGPLLLNVLVAYLRSRAEVAKIIQDAVDRNSQLNIKES